MTAPDGMRSSYDRSASDWDQTFGAEAINRYHRQALWRAFQAVLGTGFGSGRAIELGVGTGLFTDRLAPQFQRLIAVDYSQPMLDTLADKMVSRKVHNIEYVCSKAEDMAGIDEASVDVVYCFGLIENIPDIDPMFREIHRVLKPGGRFAGIVSNRNCPWYALRERLHKDRWYWQGIRLYTPEDLRAAAKAAGLSERLITGWGLIPSQLPDSPLLAPIALAERVLERTPLRWWMGGLAFGFAKP